MSTTLPLFWHLSSASKTERIDASVKLISTLEHFQCQKVPATSVEEDSDDSDDDQENAASKFKDDLDLLNAQDVSYSIRRLLRGLASPRECSRLGFAVALTELLSRLRTVTSAQILGLIMDNTQLHGSMKGQDERDILFARLFGISSVIQSGLAVRADPPPDLVSPNNSSSSLECFREMINSLLTLGDQKSWLRESSWFTISLAVKALHESENSWKEGAVEGTLCALFTEHTVWSTEKLALALDSMDYFPSRNWKGYLSPTFKNTKVLSTANLATVAQILKESATDEDGVKDPTKAPNGGWKPRLNFAWNIILDQLLPGPNSEKEPKGSFQDFYRIVVDESLFSASSSVNKKYWGFQVFQESLKKADQNTVPTLFTKNFMRTWINHLSKKDRYLHKMALQTATEVESFVKNKPQLGFAVILQLTGPNGNQQFDRLTKTKTVETILSTLDVEGVEKYVRYLLSQVNDGSNSTDLGAINSRRAWIIDQFVTIIRNQKVPRADTWIINVLDWLTIHGLFVIRKKSSKGSFLLQTIPSPPLSDELRQTCRDKLLICLGDLCHQIMIVTEGDSTRKEPGVASDGEFWISKVALFIQELEKDHKHVGLLEEADEESLGLRSKLREILDTLKTSKLGQDASKGVELLLLGTLFMHLCQGADDDDGHGDDPLEACIDGVTQLLTTISRKKKKEETNAAPIDILVDIVIGFLEKGTSFTRSIGNQSFSLLSGLVKDSTVELIVTQLERRDPSQLVEEEEVMDIVEEDESEEDESDSGKSSEENDGDGDESDSSGEGEVDLELRRKIEEALRINGIEPSTGETESEEEELLDDDQMMAIDEQLVEAFRARANEKKGKNIDAQREATHFKSRVLDLVDAYLRNEPSNPLVLQFILPLVELAIASSQDERQLADKAKATLRSRLGKTKECPSDVGAEQLTEISTTIHELARRARSAENLTVLGLCAVYLAKVSIHSGHGEIVVGVYREDLHDFTKRKKSGLHSSFFQEFFKKYPACGWQLRNDMVDDLTEAVNTYRQGQVIRLLNLIFSLLPSFNVSEDEVQTFMPRLRNQVLNIAEEACKDTGNLTTAQMKELLKLALSGVRQTARILPNVTDSLWKSKKWRSLTEKLDSSPKLKSSPVLKKLCENIAHTVEVSAETPQHSKKAKRKAEVLDTSGSKISKKKKV